VMQALGNAKASPSERLMSAKAVRSSRASNGKLRTP
jgi:hypothetical protein